VDFGSSWPTHPIWPLRQRARAAARWIASSERCPKRPWSALDFSAISQDVFKIINIFTDSFDPLNGTSLKIDVTIDQAAVANDAVADAPISNNGKRT
jgi:hypothetical protein